MAKKNDYLEYVESIRKKVNSQPIPEVKIYSTTPESRKKTSVGKPMTSRVGKQRQEIPYLKQSTSITSHSAIPTLFESGPQYKRDFNSAKSEYDQKKTSRSDTVGDLTKYRLAEQKYKKAEREANQSLASDTSDKANVMDAVSKWNTDGYKMTDAEKKQAKEIHNAVYSGNNSDIGIGKVAENTGYTEDELLAINRAFNKTNPVQSFMQGIGNSAIIKGGMDALYGLEGDQNNEQERYKQSAKDASTQNPLLYGAGTFAGRGADYAIGNNLVGATGIANGVSNAAVNAVNKIPFLKGASNAIGQSAGNLVSGELADVMMDTIPTLTDNVKSGKYNTDGSFNGGQMALDTLKNLGVNAAFNSVFEIPGLASGIRNATRTGANTVDDAVVRDTLQNIQDNVAQDSEIIASGSNSKPVLDEMDNLPFKTVDEANEALTKPVNEIPSLEPQQTNGPIIKAGDAQAQDVKPFAFDSLNPLESKKVNDKYLDPADKALKEPDALVTHTPDEIKSMNDYVNSTDNGILEYQNMVRNSNGKDKIKPYNLKSVSDRMADDVYKLTGIDVSGNTIEIDKDFIKHVDKRHGIKGEADHSMADDNTLARIQYVLDNYDNAYKGGESSSKRMKDHSKSPTIVFTKKVDGHYYVVEAITDAKSKRNVIQSAYIGNENSIKESIKKGSITQMMDTTDKSAPHLTSETETGSTSFLDSIPSVEKNINENIPTNKVMAEDTGLGSSAVRPEDSALNKDELTFNVGRNANGDAEIGMKTSKFRSNTMENSGIDSTNIMKELYPDQYKYAVETEPESLAKASVALQDMQACETIYLDDAIGKVQGDAVDCDTMMGMYKQYINERTAATQVGDTELANSIQMKINRLTKNIQEKATKAGQFNQAFAKYTRTADGAIMKANSLGMETAEKAAKANPREMRKIQNAGDEIEKEIQKMQDDGLWDELMRANEVQSKVEDVIRKAVAGNAHMKKTMTDENISKLAGNMVDEWTQYGELLKTLDDFEMMGMTGFTGIDDSVAQKVRDLFDEADKLGYNSRARVELENQAYAELANALKYNGTFAEKFNQWRYFAMLANAKTHIRNVIGNVSFGQITNLKDNIGAAIENVVDNTSKALGGQGIEKTKSFIDKSGILSSSDKALYNASKQNADEMYRVLSDGNKYYNVGSSIESNRKIFKSDILNKITELNTKALDKEDWWGLKTKYGDSLARYLKANGADESIFKSSVKEDIELLEKAQNHAIEEAKKATFHQKNKVAEELTKFSNAVAESGTIGGKVAHIAIEGTDPFKKTPPNIMASAVAYSPLETGKMMLDLPKVYKGTMKASEFIDDIAKGATGTGLFLTGLILGKSGILKGGPDKDTGNQDALIGKQTYSLQIGDKSYTIDNFAPVSTILLVGANLGQNEGDDSKLNKIVNSLTTVADPIMETTMLSGLANTLSAAKYAETSTDVMKNMAVQVGTNYASQVVPSLLGNEARTIDNTRRSTYTDKSGVPGTLQRTANSIKNKIPVLSQSSQPSVDAWGREQTYLRDDMGILGRAAYQNFSPGYYSKENVTPADSYLQSLYDDTKNASVFPEKAKSSFSYDGQSYKLNPEQYTQFSKDQGQTSLEIITALSTDSDFNSLSDEQKQDAIDKAYAVSKKVAQAGIIGDDYVSTDKAYNAYKDGGVKELIPYLGMYEAINTSGLSSSDKTEQIYKDKGQEGLETYMDLKSKADTNGNGSITSEEAKRRLDSMPLSRSEKRYWFSKMSTAKNPY